MASRSFANLLVGTFFLAAVGVVLWWITDTSITWMHPEIFGAERHYLNNEQLYWRDVWRFFDCNVLSDECHRTRFLSYLLGFLNHYFRGAVAGIMPPHPSLSLTWPLSFAGAYFFWRLLRNLTDNASAALVGTGLYVVSPGFLSGLVLLFNPAKPLASFFVTFTLWLASEIGRKDARQGHLAAALCAAVFLAYCSDETAWFLYGAIPLLFPGVILRRDRRALAFGFLATFPLFLAFVTWVVPYSAEYFWRHQHFDFWGWTFNIGRSSVPTEMSLLERFAPGNLWVNAATMANSQFGIAGLALCGALAIAAFFAADAKQRLLLARSVVVLSAFTVFQSLLLLRQANSVSNVLSGTFYYGALFSVFSLIVVTISIGTLMGRKWALLPTVAASAYMAIVSGTSFHDFNARWIAIHNDIYAEQIGDSFGRLDKDAALTWARIERYWSARGDASRLHAMRGEFAPKDAWLFIEVK